MANLFLFWGAWAFETRQDKFAECVADSVEEINLAI